MPENHRSTSASHPFLWPWTVSLATLLVFLQLTSCVCSETFTCPATDTESASEPEAEGQGHSWQQQQQDNTDFICGPGGTTTTHCDGFVLLPTEPGESHCSVTCLNSQCHAIQITANRTQNAHITCHSNACRAANLSLHNDAKMYGSNALQCIGVHACNNMVTYTYILYVGRYSIALIFGSCLKIEI